MKRLFRSKRAMAGLITAAVVGLAIGAFAFFTSTGTGTGQVQAGHSTAFNVAVVTGTTGDLTPITGTATTPADTVTFTVTNPSSGSQNLGKVTASVTSGFTSGPAPACTASDFSISGNPVGTPFVFTAGLPKNLAANATFTGTVTVTMVDNGLNQDSCQNVFVPLTFQAGQ